MDRPWGNNLQMKNFLQKRQVEMKGLMERRKEKAQYRQCFSKPHPNPSYLHFGLELSSCYIQVPIIAPKQWLPRAETGPVRSIILGSVFSSSICVCL